MEIQNVKHVVTAVKPEQYPVHRLAEVALVGRSNVGKSSLINVLAGRKNLARESATPGKTREINFYSIGRTLYFVDLPGYGYARVSKTEKASWEGMIETYLTSREQLKLILMLVDIRHVPSNEDQMMVYWLKHQELPSLVVATKLDKIKRHQVNKQLQQIHSTLNLNEAEEIIPFSAVTKQGRDQIWNRMMRLIG